MIAVTLDDSVMVLNLTNKMLHENDASAAKYEGTRLRTRRPSRLAAEKVEIKEDTEEIIIDKKIDQNNEEEEPYSSRGKIKTSSTDYDDELEAGSTLPLKSSGKRKRGRGRGMRSISSSRQGRRNRNSMDYSEGDTEAGDGNNSNDEIDSPLKKKGRRISKRGGRSSRKKTREEEIRAYTNDQDVIDLSVDNTPLDASIVDQFEDLPLLPEPENKFGLSHKPKPSNLPRKYICDFCESGFKSSSHLEEHRRLHTGEKPYKCPVCPFEASHGSNYRLHLRDNHPEIDPYPCPHCDRAFKQKKDYRNHVKEHPKTN
ncbi:DgyrCDS7963 [Dimorphilus gyrociliatus]|uniref:DgyrCDS7963 n=1 Tax=Dimorphilus gyrociliatus TaxID=2664684 RepID=A0A7I8VXP2_9ANNE|nr:DgyrCDS7963 [Dimorphilus gyrociliatus]